MGKANDFLSARFLGAKQDGAGNWRTIDDVLNGTFWTGKQYRWLNSVTAYYLLHLLKGLTLPF